MQWWKAPKGLSSSILCDDCGISWRKYADFTKPVIREESVPASAKGKAPEKREGTPLNGPSAKRSKVRIESIPVFQMLLTTKPYRQRNLSHPHLRPSLRTNVSHAITTAPSERSSNVKNAASRPTRERLVSSPNRWMWTTGCARSARTIKCKRRRWIRPVCFVPRSSTILKMGFIRLRIRSCVRRSLQRDRDGCTCFVQCSYRSSRSAIPRGYGWLRVLA